VNRGRQSGVVAVAALAGLAASVVAGCAADPSDVAAGPNAGAVAVPNGETVDVDVLDNSFRAMDLTVKAGTTVQFTNRGRNDHNVLPQPDSLQGWGVGEAEFAPGSVYRHVFDTPGTYDYICTIHGVKGKGMVGTIVVTSD
jgi:plastocyanin